MASRQERVFIIVVTGAFLITTIGVSVAVIWQATQDNSANNTTSLNTTSSNSNKLQGTKLKDFTPIASVPTLQIIDTTPGTGQAVQASSTVTVDYTGAVASTGIIFQSSLDTGQTATFSLGQVIPGWQTGMVGMKVGGTRRLLIPAAQAYGASPPAGSGIPSNADLVFDITLHSISQ